MAKKPPSSESGTPQEFPSALPRDLHPTTDIRFVIHELGKLTALVERLIIDTDSHGKKIGEVKDAISFVKGAIWVIGLGVFIVSGIIGLILSGKVSVSFH